MKSFDSTFFKELSRISDLELFGENGHIDLTRQDSSHHISDLHAMEDLGCAFAVLLHMFVATLSQRSNGRYVFEEDFGVRPWQVFSFSKGARGRKQLHIRFDAFPLNRLISTPWGVSIGLGFDLRGEKGIHAACVDDYEAFNSKVFCEPELFDATFGSLGSYAEPTGEFKEVVTAEKAWQTVPSILDNWLFFGRRVSTDTIAAYGTLEGFVDECIRVFDVICGAGYYNLAK